MPSAGASSGLQPLAADDEALVLAAVAEAMSDMQHWSAMPESWWDARKNVRVAGVGEMQLYSKRGVFPGGTAPAPPLFLGVIEFEDVSLDELKYLSAAGEGCAKLRFDPSLASFETRLTVPAPWGEPVKYFRIHSRPALLGLISAREIDSICGVRDLPDGRRLEVGVGLRSPVMVQHCGGSSRISQLQAETPTPGMVQAKDYTGGFIHEPMDLASRSGGRGRCRSMYFLSSEAGGGVPRWASERGVPDAVVNFYAAAYKELLRVRSLGGSAPHGSSS